ncbi:GNAT family N-acetyltransferase [Gallaecimonas sp. GXIMD4217]|uniref:GNAT family N-acetyltransferase n=1 Tax=Gallaecimonas sp. GXIMD4217 TaxID=3131927 RepID=UPI00311B3CBB
MQIDVINERDDAVFDALVAGVREHNAEHLGSEAPKPLSVVARDASGKLIGGLSGKTFSMHFLIDVLWVDEASRGTGLGSKVMALAEAEAIERGCVAAQVDTLSFQAPAFYQKLGFEVVGSITGFAEHPDRRCFPNR